MRILKRIAVIFMITFFGACTSGDIKNISAAVDTKAYDFTLSDQNGKSIKLSSVLKKYRGAVIAFYPKDDTKK